MSFSGATPPANPPTFDTGACAGKGLMMDPAPGDEIGVAFAKALCAGCPVLDQCRTWMSTLDRKTDPGGVLAGTTLEERVGHDPDRKVCRRCWHARPRSAFTPNSRAGDLRSWCRVCSAASLADRRAKEAAEEAA